MEKSTFQNCKHGIFYTIDTEKLETRMQAINWHQHPAHWFLNEDEPSDLILKEMRSIEADLHKLGKLDGPDEAVIIWEQLMVKYFSGTPLEIALTDSVPYLTASFSEYKKTK